MRGQRRKKLPIYSTQPSTPSYQARREAGEHAKNAIAIVNDVCTGAKTYSLADEMASEVISKLWRLNGFTWDLEEIRAFARYHIQFILKKTNGSNTKTFTDYEDEEGRLPFIVTGGPITNPFEHCRAQEALALLKHLPKNQESALRIMIDGGTPIDVAKEHKIDIYDALQLLRDARKNIHLVADDDDI